jgi:hypothetical protein
MRAAKRSSMGGGPMWLGRRLIAAIAVVVVVGGAVWGLLAGRAERTNDADDEAVSEPQRVSIVDGLPVVTLDAATQAASGLKTTALDAIAYQQQLRAYGTVLDLQQLTELGNSYIAARAARQTAQAKLTASKPAFERAQTLYRDKAASAAQVQAAEAAFRVDEAGVAAADSQLRTLTATARQAWGPTLAQALVDRTPMFTRLVDRQDVLLQVTLPPGVVVGKAPTTAFVVLANGSRAALQFVSPATKTDPHIQGVSFFYTAPATTGLLPGMSVLVFVPSDASVDGTLVPAAAVIWWQGRAWVYLKSGADRFARHAITTDLPTPDGSYVARGLPAANEVVTQGAQMLLSEELRGQMRVSGD